MGLSECVYLGHGLPLSMYFMPSVGVENPFVTSGAVMVRFPITSLILNKDEPEFALVIIRTLVSMIINWDTRLIRVLGVDLAAIVLPTRRYRYI